jgi:hypothetical protein
MPRSAGPRGPGRLHAGVLFRRRRGCGRTPIPSSVDRGPPPSGLCASPCRLRPGLLTPVQSHPRRYSPTRSVNGGCLSAACHNGVRCTAGVGGGLQTGTPCTSRRWPGRGARLRSPIIRVVSARGRASSHTLRVSSSARQRSRRTRRSPSRRRCSLTRPAGSLCRRAGQRFATSAVLLAGGRRTAGSCRHRDDCPYGRRRSHASERRHGSIANSPIAIRSSTLRRTSRPFTAWQQLKVIRTLSRRTGICRRGIEDTRAVHRMIAR